MAAARFGWYLDTIMPLLKAERDMMTRHLFWHCHSFGITTFPLCLCHSLCHYNKILFTFDIALCLSHFEILLKLHYNFWNISWILQHAFGIPILFEFVRFFWHYNSLSYHPFTTFFWQSILVSDCFDIMINLASILFW